MFITYILYSSLHNRYYIGSTNDIEKRISRHNKGFTKSTKSFRPWVLIYQECFDTKTDARKRENQIKSYKSGRAFKQLIENSWADTQAVNEGRL